MPGHQHDDDAVRVVNNIEFLLADADRFDNDDILAHGFHDVDRVARGLRQAAQCAARGERPDEHAFVFRVPQHADAVAQNRAAGERAGRVNGQNADGFFVFAEFADERVGQRAFARAGRAGNADDKRFACVGKELFAAGDEPAGSLSSRSRIRREAERTSPAHIFLVVSIILDCRSIR